LPPICSHRRGKGVPGRNSIIPRKANPCPEKRLPASGQFYVYPAGKQHWLGKDEEKAERRRREIIAGHVLGCAGEDLLHKLKLEIGRLPPEQMQSLANWLNLRLEWSGAVSRVRP
jgi:hypothetical protein